VTTASARPPATPGGALDRPAGPPAPAATLLDRVRRPAVSSVVGAVVVGTGFVLGGRPLQDNSFFTHLATGRLIVGSGHVPHHDPYSFTARGTSWVVQSWLPSLVYGLSDKLAGAAGIRLVVAVTAAVLAWVCWRLTRPAVTLLPRSALGVVALLVGTTNWVERPLLFGLLALALTVLAAEGGLDARWLAPIFWLWANSHGSFPLGLLALAVFALGRHLDGEAVTVEVRCLIWAVAGTVAAMVNPFGPALLVFPMRLLQRHDLLANVVEWQPPRFDDVGQAAFLGLTMLAVLGLARRPSWRQGLAFVVYVTAALLGARNVPVAALVLLPGLAGAAAGIGTVPADTRRAAHLGLAAVFLAGSAAVVAARPDYRLDVYPVASVAYLEGRGLVPGGRVVAPDFVGNYLELRYGTRASVFVDDRFDMFPTSVVHDADSLLLAKPGWGEVLARWRPTAVLWPTQDALAQLLTTSAGWRVTFSEPGWIVAEPR
jgi:hypothetical protein